MIKIRQAEEADVPEIRRIYTAVYGADYPYRDVYNEKFLKRWIFNDEVLSFVAEDTSSKKILGTASVQCDFGAHSDLVGEFCRLAVLPGSRRLGVGKLLMKKRIEAVRDRLHVGLVIARVVHSYAQEISLANQFIPVGFLPLRHLFSHRESFALLARYFGDAWTLRKNNPRVIPEACSLGHSVMDRAGRTSDLIVDEDSAPYPPSTTFRLEELSVEGFSSLMRIERGRVRNREVFGSMRLEYGFFRLKARHANYLVAKDESRIVGAIGFTLSPAEGTVKVFELIALTDRVIHFLFSALERKCSEKEGVEYIEIDVSAHAPRMQRTLLELNFIPAAYIPAMVFHEVERLDIIKMVRLCRLQDLGPLELSPQVEGMVDRVMRGFRSRTIIPRIARAVSRIPLFQGLNTEQVTRLAGVCGIREFPAGGFIFLESEPADCMYIILSGKVGVQSGEPPVSIGVVEEGEILGELSLLTSRPHSATAVAGTAVEAAVLDHRDLSELVRRRSDIAVILYRNLAAGLGNKLLRTDQTLLRQNLGKTKAKKPATRPARRKRKRGKE